MKKILSLAMAAAVTLGAAAGATAETAAVESTATAPKYVFMFIGDGMSTPQVQSANYYLNAVSTEQSDILTTQTMLSFMEFPVVGSVQTYDSSSFCPDSASTGTSLASGHKTYSGVINMDESLTVPYTTIAEQLKAQKNYKIGVISSVNLNHATPAAYYAHQPSRGNYYEIGLEMIASNFDYFAGGGLLKPTGKDKDQTDVYELAAEAGYTVTTTQAEAEAFTADQGKVIMIDEHLADSDSMSYQIDVKDGEWTLSDYVTKGVDLLYDESGEQGFFMMVEGGKIDWACHANDAASSINEVVNISDAVDAALAFYNEHPDETLIVVTGDHETGGLTIGFAGTNYDTFLTNLASQKISYAKFDSDYVQAYIENKTSFEDVMKDVEALFGMKAAAAGEEVAEGTLTLTDYELSELQAAYDRTMAGEDSTQENMTQEEYEIYGSYEPLTVTITHLLNNKSGVAFTTYSHSGLPAAVYAIGDGATDFGGYYDNTDIYNKLAALTGVTAE